VQFITKEKKKIRTAKINTCFRYEGKAGERLILLLLKISSRTNITMMSFRDLFIDVVVDTFISSKNNQITPSPCFTFIPKTVVGLPKTEVSFYRAFDFFLILVLDTIVSHVFRLVFWADLSIHGYYLSIHKK